MEKTMDPLMRKLFQPREAREKLRGMGGIMSSSPQLASTVAKFNVGGHIQAMPPQRSDLGGAMPLASAIHGPSGMMYGEMSTQELSALANGGDRLAAEVLMMLQPPAGEQAGQGSGGFSLSNVGPNLETLTAPFIGTSRDASAHRSKHSWRTQNLSEFEREALEDTANGSSPYFTLRACLMQSETLSVDVSARQVALRGLDSAIGATDAGAALLEAYDAGYYDSNSPRYRDASQPTDSGAPAPAETPEDEARRMLLRQDRRAATPVDEADADPVADPETTPDDNQDAPLENLDPNDPDTFDTTYDKMLTRLQSVMGTKDEDSRQKAMANLAMIGLAIAAGQSPDALTNIAQGALTGVKAIREDQAAAKEQDKALRMAALNAALEMEQGTRTIEATAARDDLKFDRDVVLAGLRGDSGRNPRAIEDFVQNVYTEALKAASGVARPDDMVEGENPEAYAARKRKHSRQYMGQQFPAYGGTAVPAADDCSEDERQLLGGA
jgi:hypothetical protein